MADSTTNVNNMIVHEQGAPITTSQSVTATTSFNDDAIIQRSFYDVVDLHTNEIPVLQQGLKDFLSKPQLINSYSYSDSTVPGVVLDTGSIFSALTTNVAWMNKIQGYNLVRGTAVIRVQVNANPFQLGKLIIHYLPCVSNINNGDPVYKSYENMHNYNNVTQPMLTLTAATQHPHVELDMRDTAAELRIPYITPFYWLDLKSSRMDWGTYYVRPMTPLLSGTSGDFVQVDTYLWFEDFEFCAPSTNTTLTAMDITPMMQVSNGRSARKPKRKTKGLSTSYGAISDKEAVKSQGPITTMLSTGASIATTLATIPSLTPIAEPASWVLNAAAGLASSFGWSKVDSETGTLSMGRVYQRNMANSDGIQDAYPLGILSQNKVSIIESNTPYDCDEMSWSFLKSVRYLFINRAYVGSTGGVEWTTAQPSGTSLLSFQVSPQNLGAIVGLPSGSTSVNQVSFGGPINYFSYYFLQYRGSIDLTFKFIKTQYHSGRLQITFTPYTAGTIATPDLNTSILSLREIVDIRECNQFVFNLPYLYSTDYLQQNQPLGQLDVIILTELRAPDTASSVLPIQLYCNGGKDFEFQIPIWNPVSTVYNNVPIGPVVPAMDVGLGQTDLVVKGVGNMPVANMRLEHSSVAVGEVFTSLKQLLNRYSQITNIPTYTAPTFDLVITPYFMGNYIIDNVSTLDPGAYVQAVGDIYSIVGNLFAFFRGSVKFLCRNYVQTTLTNTPVPDSLGATLIPNYVVGAAPLISQSQDGPGNVAKYVAANYLVVTPIVAPTSALSSVAFGDPNIGFMEVRVPYYNSTRMSFNLPPNRLTDIGFQILGNPTVPTVGLDFNSNFGFNQFESFYRSFADDFQLSFFVGCPPLLLGVTSS